MQPQQRQKQKESKNRFAGIMNRVPGTKRTGTVPSRLLRSSFIHEIRKPPPVKSEITDIENNKYDELEAINCLDNSIFDLEPEEGLDSIRESENSSELQSKQQNMSKPNSGSLVQKFTTNDSTNEHRISDRYNRETDEESMNSFLSKGNEQSLSLRKNRTPPNRFDSKLVSRQYRDNEESSQPNHEVTPKEYDSNLGTRHYRDSDEESLHSFYSKANEQASSQPNHKESDLKVPPRPYRVPDDESLHSFLSKEMEQSSSQPNHTIPLKVADSTLAPMEDVVVVAGSSASTSRTHSRPSVKHSSRSQSSISSSRSKIERARQKMLARNAQTIQSSMITTPVLTEGSNRHLDKKVSDNHSLESNQTTAELSTSVSKFLSLPLASSSSYVTDAAPTRKGGRPKEHSADEVDTDLRTRISVMEYQLQMLEQSCDVQDISLIPLKLQDLTEASERHKKIIEDLERTRDGLEKQLLEAEAKYKHREEEAMSMKNLEAQLSQAMVGYKDKCKALEDRITSVQEACQVNDIIRLPQMFQQLIESRAHAESKHIEAQQLLDLTKENNNQLLYELSVAREQVKVLNELPAQIEQLNHELDESKRAFEIRSEDVSIMRRRELQSTSKEDAMRQIQYCEMHISKLEGNLESVNKQNQQLVNDLLVAREEAKQSTALQIKIQQLERDLQDTKLVVEQKNQEILVLQNSSVQVMPTSENSSETQCKSVAEEQIEQIKAACSVNDVLLIPVIIAKLKESLRKAESKNLETPKILEEGTAQNSILRTDLPDSHEQVSTLGELPTNSKPEVAPNNTQRTIDHTLPELESQRNLETHSLRQIHDTPEITSTGIEEKINKMEGEYVEKIQGLNDSLRKLEILQMEALQERDFVAETNQTLLKELNDARAKVMALSVLPDRIKQLERDLEESQRGIRQRRLETTENSSDLAELSKALQEYATKCTEYDRQMKILSESCNVDDIAAVPDMISQLQDMLITTRTCQMNTQNDVAHLAKKNKFLLVELDSLSAKHEEEKAELTKQVTEANEKLDDLNKKLVVIQEKCRVKHYDELPERIVFLERKLVEFYHELQKSKLKGVPAVTNAQNPNSYAPNRVASEQARHIDTSERAKNNSKTTIESPKSNEESAAEILLVKNELQVYKTKTEQARAVLFSLQNRCKVEDVNEIPGKMQNLEMRISELTSQAREQSHIVAQVEEFKKSMESSNAKVETLQQELKVAKADLVMARDRIAFLSQEISKFPIDIDLKPERSQSSVDKGDLRRAAFSLNIEPDLDQSLTQHMDGLPSPVGNGRGRLDFTARLESFLMDNTPAFIDTGRLDSVHMGRRVSSDKRLSSHSVQGAEILEIERLKEALSESTAKVEDLEREMIHLQMACKVRSVQDIPEKLAAFEEDVAVMDEMYVQLEASEELVAELRLQLQETEEALEASYETVHDLRSVLSETQNNMKRANEELAAKDAAIFDLTETTRHISSDLGKQNIRSANLENLIKELTEKLRDAHKEREIMRDHQLAELKRLKDDLERRDMQVAEIRAELEDNLEELAEKSSAMEILEEARKFSSAKIDELEAIIDVKRNGGMEEHLMNQSLECVNLKSKFESLQQKLKIAENRAQAFQDESNQKTMLIDQLNGSGLSAEEVAEILRGEHERTLRRATEARIKLAESSIRVTQLTEELTRIRKSWPLAPSCHNSQVATSLEVDAASQVEILSEAAAEVKAASEVEAAMSEIDLTMEGTRSSSSVSRSAAQDLENVVMERQSDS